MNTCLVGFFEVVPGSRNQGCHTGRTPSILVTSSTTAYLEYYLGTPKEVSVVSCSRLESGILLDLIR